ncbi:MFS transporter [Streptomyces bauhiniae]|uniref:MFS transporter n=1 Tax=Streptomyces bauhiniae TaxID=2340725 RepID=UPI003803617F
MNRTHATVDRIRPAHSRNPWPAVSVLAFVAAVATLQNTVVVPMLPVLQRDLHTSYAAAGWTVTGSLLSGAIAIPLFSRFGDLYGRRTLSLVTLGMLTLGAVVSATAGGIGWMVAGRVLQGAGSALLPLAVGIVRELLPERRLPTGIGVVSATVGLGSGAGMVMAGLFAGNYRALFWTIGALGAGCMVLVGSVIRSDSPRGEGRPDLPGAALLCAALLCLLLATSQGGAWGWTAGRTLGVFGAAALAGVLWAVTARRVATPLIEPAMLTDRRTVGASVASFLLGFALFVMMTTISGFTQSQWDASVLRVGGYLLPTTTLMLVFSVFSGRLMRRFSASALVTSGSVLVGLSGLWLALSCTGDLDVYAASTLLGGGIGISYAALGVLAVQHVAPEKTAAASGVNTLARAIGGAASGAVTTAILNAVGEPAGYRWNFANAAVGAGLAAAFVAVYSVLNRTLLRAPVPEQAGGANAPS